MEISYKIFFEGLNVDVRYFNSKFKALGVKSSFFYNEFDLKNIVDNLSTARYKSVLVVERASSLLGKK